MESTSRNKPSIAPLPSVGAIRTAEVVDNGLRTSSGGSIGVGIGSRSMRVGGGSNLGSCLGGGGGAGRGGGVGLTIGGAGAGWAGGGAGGDTAVIFGRGFLSPASVCRTRSTSAADRNGFSIVATTLANRIAVAFIC